MIHALAIAALLLAQQPGFSQEPEKPCLTRVEAREASLFFLPGFIEGAARKCSAALPPNAFLRTGSAPLAQRIRGEAGNRWPAARAAIEKVRGERLPGFLGENALMRMAEGGGVAALLRDVEASECGKIDEAMAALSPLPADNLARLLVIALEEAGDDPQRPFNICAAPRQ